MNSKIIQRIQKLLALADNQDGTPEGEQAAAIAAKLMKEHAISMATLTIEQQRVEDPLTEERYTTSSSQWARSLMWVLARHCNCKAIAYIGWRYSKGKTMGIVGHKTDIEVAKYLFDICKRQIEKACAEHVALLTEQDMREDWEYQDYCWDQGREPSLRGYRRRVGTDFKTSAVSGLSSKLQDIRDQQQADDEQGWALVRNRNTAVQAEYNRRHPDATNSKGSNRNWNSAGYSAGKNVRLSPGVGTSGNRSMRAAKGLLK